MVLGPAAASRETVRDADPQACPTQLRFTWILETHPYIRAGEALVCSPSLLSSISSVHFRFIASSCFLPVTFICTISPLPGGGRLLWLLGLSKATLLCGPAFISPSENNQILPLRAVHPGLRYGLSEWSCLLPEEVEPGRWARGWEGRAREKPQGEERQMEGSGSFLRPGCQWPRCTLTPFRRTFPFFR